MTSRDLNIERDPWSGGQSRLASVRVEDDIRDALQSVRVTQPPIGVRIELLRLTASAGVDFTFVGFPAASPTEHDRCIALARTIGTERLRITPVLMARATLGDVDDIARVQDAAKFPVLADIYVPTSEIRAYVEGWGLEQMLGLLLSATRRAQELGLEFRVAFEDSTRTSPEAMATALDLAIETGTSCLVVNDTVGTSLPSGATQHVSFVVDHLQTRGVTMELAWHGHNDKGLALANAVAAATAGAGIISGTFTGVGERTGNIPLEQLIYLLVEAGNSAFDLAALPHLCDVYTRALGADVPPSAPIIGRDAFSTATGTHAAAIVKARAISEEVADLVYSGIEARLLGREQKLMIGPGSGRAAVRAVLEAIGEDPRIGDVEAILARCQMSASCYEGSMEILRELRRVRDDAPVEAPCHE